MPTKGLDVTTVMNLLRGRVGSPVVLRRGLRRRRLRDVDLQRGMIYVAGREILDQALATHAKFGSDVVREGGDAARYPAL